MVNQPGTLLAREEVIPRQPGTTAVHVEEGVDTSSRRDHQIVLRPCCRRRRESGQVFQRRLVMVENQDAARIGRHRLQHWPLVREIHHDHVAVANVGRLLAIDARMEIDLAVEELAHDPRSTEAVSAVTVIDAEGLDAGGFFVVHGDDAPCDRKLDLDSLAARRGNSHPLRVGQGEERARDAIVQCIAQRSLYGSDELGKAIGQAPLQEH
jgi:hypothetical protein